MKTTIFALTQAIPVFQEIITIPFPARQAYILSRLTKKLDEEMNNYSEFRQKVVMKFAEMENGRPVIENGNYKIRQGEQESFQQEMIDLLNTEIKIDAQKIPISWIENTTLTPQQVNYLEPFLEIDE